VAKPPEDGSISALRLVELVNEAGLPPGVLNIVSGGERVGKEIASQPLLTGIAFTGSSRVGQQLLLRQAERGRPMVAEMGGKNAAIVMASADLDVASEGIARSAFRYSGQKCSACSRVYADAHVFDELVERLTRHARSLRIGVPWLRDTDVGALINRKAVERYSDAVRASREAASAYVVGLPPGLPSGGAYAAPALVMNVPDDHWVATDELFIPLLCIQSVNSLPEALHRTNASRYGLTAGIYTTDSSELEVFFDNIETGVAYANRAAGATTGAWPRYQSFGGWKRSGWSGKNAHSPYYLQLFMREQCQTRSV
jgi:1-pyrroline-5-carboxylate dehydrogenase